MSISTNSIFHFTKTQSAVLGMLNEGFRVKYCLETIETMTGTIKAAVPLVSFCDIPLSQVKDHILKYGKFGIGLSKDWGIERGLNPVLYIDKHSDVGKNLVSSTSTILKSQEIQGASNTYKCLADVLRYMKNYKADLFRDGKLKKRDYKFSDEREWRYVLPYSKAQMLIPYKDYNTNTKKQVVNQSIETERLKFPVHQINYIILRSEGCIQGFLNKALKLSNIKNRPDIAKTHLIKSIVTVDQILNDF